ncbi:hypothetical protein GCM10027610_085330 [Dactylosporangium cerinum]
MVVAADDLGQRRVVGGELPGGPTPDVLARRVPGRDRQQHRDRIVRIAPAQEVEHEPEREGGLPGARLTEHDQPPWRVEPRVHLGDVDVLAGEVDRIVVGGCATDRGPACHDRLRPLGGVPPDGQRPGVSAPLLASCTRNRCADSWATSAIARSIRSCSLPASRRARTTQAIAGVMTATAPGTTVQIRPRPWSAFSSQDTVETATKVSTSPQRPIIRQPIRIALSSDTLIVEASAAHGG